MTTILFIHPNFPAQFRHLAERLGEEGYRVFFLTANPRPEWVIKGVTKIIYTPKDSTNTKSLFQSVHAAETQAEAVLRACLQFAKQGITPDVIYTTESHVAHLQGGGVLISSRYNRGRRGEQAG